MQEASVLCLLLSMSCITVTHVTQGGCQLCALRTSALLQLSHTRRSPQCGDTTPLLLDTPSPPFAPTTYVTERSSGLGRLGPHMTIYARGRILPMAGDLNNMHATCMSIICCSNDRLYGGSEGMCYKTTTSP